MLGLAISGRHKGQMQSYTVIPLNIRRQVKMLYVWFLKNRGDWDAIHKENDVIEMQEDLASVKKQLKQGKHTCLGMRTEHPRACETVL